MVFYKLTGLVIICVRSQFAIDHKGIDCWETQRITLNHYILPQKCLLPSRVSEVLQKLGMVGLQHLQ